jgi:septal ring factor EnvC (AmiA/AmiB activator)
MRILAFFLIILCVCSSVRSLAQQSRTELEKQRQETLRELEEVNNTYNEIKKNKKESLGQLQLVERKIRLRNQEIDNINAQMRAVDDSMFLINREIYRLKGDLDTLKANYAKSLVYAYQNRSSYDFLNFIFSATSFNDAVRRVEYLRSYRTDRERQVSEIMNTENLISGKAKDFANTKVQKAEVLTNDSKARLKLEEEKEEKNEVVANLKSKETELGKTIANKKSQLARLQNAISSVVKREIENARKEEEAKAERERKANALAAKNAAAEAKANASPTQPTPSRSAPASAESGRPVTMTPTTSSSASTTNTHVSVLLNSEESITLANNFVSNKGRLPWPVSKGYIISHYGKNQIEGTRIDFYETGITIGTDVGSPVKAVFEGDVSSVFDMGGGTNVIIKHGNFFTSYTNLASCNVNKGDHVKTGQTLGTIAAGDSGNGQMEFILMRDSNRLNPEEWLRSSAGR